jgi:hypothetical protein
MIKTLSPYYITIPFVAPLSGLTSASFTLKLFIWNGSKSTPPSEATYEITKENPTASTASVKINVARFVSDFIDFEPSIITTTGEVDGNNQQWLKWETTYLTSSETDALVSTNRNTVLYTKGYSYAMDGENATTPANKILIPIQEYKVSTNSIFIVPVEIDEPAPPVETITITDVDRDGDLYDIVFISSFPSDFFNYRWRVDGGGDDDWEYGITNALELVEITTVAGDYEVQVYAYNNVLGANVFSNIFDFTVV